MVSKKIVSKSQYSLHVHQPFTLSDSAKNTTPMTLCMADVLSDGVITTYHFIYPDSPLYPRQQGWYNKNIPLPVALISLLDISAGSKSGYKHTKTTRLQYTTQCIIMLILHWCVCESVHESVRAGGHRKPFDPS